MKNFIILIKFNLKNSMNSEKNIYQFDRKIRHGSLSKGKRIEIREEKGIQKS